MDLYFSFFIVLRLKEIWLLGIECTANNSVLRVKETGFTNFSEIDGSRTSPYVVRCHLTKRSSKWCISAKGWLMQIDKSWSLNYVLHSAASIYKSPEVSVTWSKCARHSFYILTSCGPCLSLLSVIPHLYSWSIRFIQYFVLVPPTVSSIILFHQVSHF